MSERMAADLACDALHGAIIFLCGHIARISDIAITDQTTCELVAQHLLNVQPASTITMER